ncbi:MAG: hypothetical protein WCK78_04210 [Paludibacter sp.]
MRKTGGEIEEEVYDLIDKSTIKTNISGELYREGMRPLNAETEDAVVSFLTGLDGQIQTGVLNLNLYVPDIVSNNLTVKNTSRCTELEKLVNSFIQSHSVSGDYYFELDKTIQTYKAEGIEQHFVNCRIKFQLSTF